VPLLSGIQHQTLPKRSADECQPPVLILGSIDSTMLEKIELKALSFILAKSFDGPADVRFLNADPF